MGVNVYFCKDTKSNEKFAINVEEMLSVSGSLYIYVDINMAKTPISHEPNR